MMTIKKKYLFLLVFLFGLLINCKSQTPIENNSWITKIRNEHPRLFFNQDSFKEVKEKALHDEQKLFDEMKNRVDLLFEKKIVFKDSLVRDGQQNSDHMYGTRAAEAAFLYLVLEDEKYFELSKKILIKIIDYYELRNKHKLNIQWYAHSRINALAAYDWIYNDLSDKERTEIGSSLLRTISAMSSMDREKVFRKNYGGIKSGFYGPPALPWYAGLVFHKTGIDDALSVDLLQQGYDDHIALLEHRSTVAGEKGGAASATINYSTGAYPWAEYNFLHTFNAATGIDISKQWDYMPKFLNYVFWNWLPGEREFGYGDSRHIDNKLSLRLMPLHIDQLTHFYGESHPDLIALGKWMKNKIPRQKQESFPFARFLLTKSHDDIKPKSPSDNQPKAMFFKNMGQIFMRSGSGPDDTYAVFTAGGMLTQHRHFDNNNFNIFKRGFLTVDSGTRPQPGIHLSHYYSRTVAHNSITIKMPGEKMPWYWGGPALNEEDLPVPNDGGQNNLLGSEVIAFEENEDYVYIASDATKSYHPDKADLVVRQFVFILPDHFVIMDRVSSTQSDYKKRWLLHTATEPVVNKKEFYADHWEGRIFSKTLFPENAELTKIGGPGKQFWSDGRNWPLPELTPDDWNYGNSDWLDNDHPLFGQWRIEVSPTKPDTDDAFLHLLQVGDKSLETMANSTALKTDDMVGVRFVHDNKEYEVMFFTNSEPGGTISVSQDGEEILRNEFTDKVEPQKMFRKK